MLVESEQVVVLAEVDQGKNYPDVIYFPSLVLSLLDASKTSNSSYCPIKGYASYWSFRDLQNCIWSYQDPVMEMVQIKNHFSFDLKQGFRVVKKSA